MSSGRNLACYKRFIHFRTAVAVGLWLTAAGVPSEGSAVQAVRNGDFGTEADPCVGEVECEPWSWYTTSDHGSLGFGNSDGGEVVANFSWFQTPWFPGPPGHVGLVQKLCAPIERLSLRYRLATVGAQSTLKVLINGKEVDEFPANDNQWQRVEVDIPPLPGSHELELRLQVNDPSPFTNVVLEVDEVCGNDCEVAELRIGVNSVGFGHAVVALNTPSGQHLRGGYVPASLSWIIGPGFYFEDYTTPTTEISFSLSQSEYITVRDLWNTAWEQRNDPPIYIVTSNNCTDWALQFTTAIDVPLAPLAVRPYYVWPFGYILVFDPQTLEENLRAAGDGCCLLGGTVAFGENATRQTSTVPTDGFWDVTPALLGEGLVNDPAAVAGTLGLPFFREILEDTLSVGVDSLLTLSFDVEDSAFVGVRWSEPDSVTIGQGGFEHSYSEPGVQKLRLGALASCGVVEYAVHVAVSAGARSASQVIALSLGPPAVAVNAVLPPFPRADDPASVDPALPQSAPDQPLRVVSTRLSGPHHVLLTLEHRGRVALSAYDASGRFIDRFFDGDLDAGQHDVIWKGAKASGIFFVRAEGPSGVIGTTRVVHVR